ncbi:MAG TPA: hypothetical protein VGR20_19265 [Acidimicrobiia bacterium]|nr:hypothetical protein [Acidimicrobiia bacterium]
MKKILVAGFVVTTTLAVSGVAAFAEEPLPGRRPPCSIIRKSPLEASVGTALCQHPASQR